MTRKQALLRVSELLAQQPQTQEIEELQSKIGELIECFPVITWDEDTIIDTLDQWVIDHGCNPKHYQLKHKGDPPDWAFRYYTGLSKKQYLEKHYPLPNPKCESEKYGFKTKEEWLAFFIDEYERIQPHTNLEYNRLRSTGSPTWPTIAAMHGIKKWTDLLSHCGFERKERRVPTPKPRVIPEYTVVIKSKLLDELEEIQNEIQKTREIFPLSALRSPDYIEMVRQYIKENKAKPASNQ